jgi:hypothetical protein
MIDALERMDTVKHIIEIGAVPRWIDMPAHYGAFRLDPSSGADKQFVLMDRVDAGVNVHHVTHPENMSELERIGFASQFGILTDEERAEIEERFYDAHDILQNAIAEETMRDPTTFLTDWSDQNVVLERLTTPVGGSNFKLWVIDQ